MKNLILLDMTKCARVAGCIEVLAGVGKVEVVRLSECWQLHGAMEKCVPRLTSLREIDLYGTKRIDGSLSNFWNLEAVTSLRLARVVGSFEHLAKLVLLQDLRLSVLNVTGSLASLERCMQLRLLQLDEYDEQESFVTGFADFAKAHPKCEVQIRKPHSLTFKVVAKLMLLGSVERLAI
mmetsp:Transcript_22979/g.60755  ORF Transcript_22979/g.60755 Transcript_22979/m.60755 type:complete len:179 (+) Transcript_22979:178-714(+)